MNHFERKKIARDKIINMKTNLLWMFSVFNFFAVLTSIMLKLYGYKEIFIAFFNSGIFGIDFIYLFIFCVVVCWISYKADSKLEQYIFKRILFLLFFVIVVLAIKVFDSDKNILSYVVESMPACLFAVLSVFRSMDDIYNNKHSKEWKESKIKNIELLNPSKLVKGYMPFLLTVE